MPDAPPPTRTDVFHHDYEPTLRLGRRVLYGLLAIIGIAMLDPTSIGQEAILSIGALLALFGILGEIHRYRARRGLPALTIGPRGVAFPSDGIDTIRWENVVRVSVVTRRSRYNRLCHLRFEFRDNRLPRRQAGSINRNRWEVSLSGSAFIFGRERLTESLIGGIDNVIESVQRFRPVDR